ncbi:putative glycosidase CRH2, partial [Dimargaris cristalligena]
RGKQSADELDFEWVGQDTTTVQSTFFVNGKNTERQSATFAKSSTDLAAEFHTYAIDFQQDKIEWLMDGVSVDSRSRAAKPTYYPENAREWRMNLWNAGAGHADWAGPTDWNSAPKSARAAISAISFESYCGADVVKGEHKLFGGAATSPTAFITAPAAAPAPTATHEPVLPAPPATQSDTNAEDSGKKC